jgi:hypothetical protein
VPPAPSVTIAVSPTSITLGDSATLSWSSTYATTCTASDALSGPEALAGSQAVSPENEGEVTYTLTCTGPGGSTTASATLTVSLTEPEAPSVDLSIDPSRIRVGGSAELSWSANNATSCVASGDWDGARPLDGTETVAPEGRGVFTYTLTCEGPGGTGEASTTLVVKSGRRFGWFRHFRPHRK